MLGGIKLVRITAVFLLSCLLCSFCSCSFVGNEKNTEMQVAPVTLTLLLPQSHYKPFLEESLKQFTQENPSIVVEPQIIPDNQWINLVKRKVAVGETPDLIRIDKGLIIDVGVEHFVEFGQEAPWYNRVLPEQMETKLIDGALYGMPIGSISSIGIAYNRTLFEKYNVPVPKTMEELREACRIFKEAGITPLYASDKDSWTAGLGFTAAAPQVVSSTTWDDLKAGRVHWTEVPEFTAILDTFASLRFEGYTNADYMKATYASAVAAMAEGDAAMYISGHFFIQDVLDVAPELDMMMTAVPYKEDVLTIIEGPGQISVFQNSSHIEEAKIFLDWFSQPGNMDVFNAGWGHMAVFKDQKLVLHPWQQALYDEYISDGKTVPQVDDILSGIDLNDFWGYQQEMMGGTLNSAQVLEKWDTSFVSQLEAKDIPGW